MPPPARGPSRPHASAPTELDRAARSGHTDSPPPPRPNADASAQLIFGAEAEDPLPALVLAKLRAAPSGLTRTELRDAFQRNLKNNDLVAALATLRDKGLIESETVSTGGRPAERWRTPRSAPMASASDLVVGPTANAG